MREILFKGKRIGNGEWVEGYFYKITYFGVDDRICAFIVVPHFENPKKASDYIMVDPKTVGQYTGLTDKNGKKIFEGDIVSTDLQRRYLIVEFRQGCFMYNCNDGGKDYYDIMLPITDKEQTCDSFVEIIGNIHDNSDLLKGGAEE